MLGHSRAAGYGWSFFLAAIAEAVRHFPDVKR